MYRKQQAALTPEQQQRQQQAMDERVELDRQKQQVSEGRVKHHLKRMKQEEHQVAMKLIRRAKSVRQKLRQRAAESNKMLPMLPMPKEAPLQELVAVQPSRPKEPKHRQRTRESKTMLAMPMPKEAPVPELAAAQQSRPKEQKCRQRARESKTMLPMPKEALHQEIVVVSKEQLPEPTLEPEPQLELEPEQRQAQEPEPMLQVNANNRNEHGDEDEDETPRPSHIVSAPAAPPQECVDDLDLNDVLIQRQQFQAQCRRSNLYKSPKALSNMSNTISNEVMKSVDADLRRSLIDYLQKLMEKKQ
ncbi:hypothetical protein KR222_001565 [Zaprionus bogoriensis]|nr:hypothetical protein KR222_001565 [Zaprionus bogoriensis]